MILYVLIALAVVVVGLVILIATRPDSFSVSRSAAIPAPASVLFEQVNDLHKFQDWSPWAKMDPNSNISYNGPVAGVGAKFSWESKKTGAGSMTILKSTPDELIAIKLDFLKPMKAVNDVEFTFAPTEGGTVVTWSMSGTNGFAAKAFGLIINCEQMCGTQFEQGLENLRELVSSKSRQLANPMNTTKTTRSLMEPMPALTPYLGVHDAVKAIEFYQKVFGAREDMRLNHPTSGKVVHAQIAISGHLIMISDAYPEFAKTPATLGGTSVRLCLRVDNVDTTVATAEKEGATVLHAPKDEFYGQRSATIRDPSGHEWMLQHVIEEVKPAELQRRFNEMVK